MPSNPVTVRQLNQKPIINRFPECVSGNYTTLNTVGECFMRKYTRPKYDCQTCLTSYMQQKVQKRGQRYKFQWEQHVNIPNA